jgi:toxin ParE1/3/4
MDLRSIWHYVARDTEVAADRLIRRLADVFARLAQNPHLGRSRLELGTGGDRSYPVGEYLIFYRVQQDRVLVAHVLHGRRDLHEYPFDIS